MPNDLERFLIGEIEKQGSISIAEFMSHALCHPQHGYYMTRDCFGREGDFTTAPEISQMFGEVLGAWVVDVWGKLGSPSLFSLVEVGPGRGTLMADMLRIFSRVEGMKSATHAHLLEASPILKQKQKEALAGYDVEWIDALEELPDAPLVIIGNEFLDALPIHQVIFRGQAWYERCVSYDPQQKEFIFVERELSEALLAYVPVMPNPNEIYEISSERSGFAASCAKYIEQKKGAALFIDYGHTKSHDGDTLQAVKGHQFVPVFSDIGNADITAHVDFEVLQDAVKKEGVDTPLIRHQGQFLKALGIEARAARLREKDPQVDCVLERLTGSQQMGQVFKVMAFYYGLSAKPEGFD